MNIIYGTVLSQCEATDAFSSNSGCVFLTQLWAVGDRSTSRVWVKLVKCLKWLNLYRRRSAGWKRSHCSFTGARGEKICQNQTSMMDGGKSHPWQWGRKSWRNVKLNKIWQKCSTSCLPSSVCGFCTWSQLSRGGCHYPLPERYNESVADTQPTCYKSCWERDQHFFPPQVSLLKHTVYYFCSIYSWLFRGCRHVLRHPERWRQKSLKKPDGRAQEMHHICSADSLK